VDAKRVVEIIMNLLMFNEILKKVLNLNLLMRLLFLFFYFILFNNQFDNLRNSEGGLLLFNNYLSTATITLSQNSIRIYHINLRKIYLWMASNIT
jgi:hypothetical protein